MGTDKVLPEVTWPKVTSVTWPEVTSVMCPVRKYVLRMRNRKLHNIRPSGNILTGSDKVTSLEEALSGSGLDRKYVLRIPGFFPSFFLSISTMATGCDQMSLDPLRGSLCVRMRNRKLCNTHSSKQCWLRCSLRRPRPIIIGNPASYI
jgi:hypothetical protein